MQPMSWEEDESKWSDVISQEMQNTFNTTIINTSVANHIFYRLVNARLTMKG